MTAIHEVEKQKKAVPQQLKDKLRIAFEHFRVVEPHHLTRFQETLYKKTKIITKHRNGYRVESWQKLLFTRSNWYKKMPPVEVLEKMKEAKALGCFDYFEIVTLEWENKVILPIPVDPILFGRIEGSHNAYFIAQWDDDIKIEDILREDEG